MSKAQNVDFHKNSPPGIHSDTCGLADTKKLTFGFAVALRKFIIRRGQRGNNWDYQWSAGRLYWLIQLYQHRKAILADTALLAQEGYTA